MTLLTPSILVILKMKTKLTKIALGGTMAEIGSQKKEAKSQIMGIASKKKVA